ncbi:putative glutamine repeat protein-1 [Phaeomoniella chlamydospora]|uniref:Putative glutamine repeat protein-1 n=1 Tax=Phaeomoniella chlamydospora TaxID=158046 RepID=A0A0G2HLI1_PHACM|nr:putative glutamine repeat protein-1 [Phaeomoniella chlamydospora]
MMPNGAFPGQIPSQNQGQAQGLVPPLSPKSATREKLRVTILLDINSSLLQEIISLQAQGKAGLPGQPSPTNEGSPNPATDPQSSVSGSPIDPSKPGSTGVKQQPSQECADCMRRLQANLSYLAAVADRHKRAAATFPASPAIMTPPPHLQSVRELYKKLNAVFPGALQALAKQNQMAMVQAQAQAHAQAQAQAQAQAMNSMQQGLS